MIQLDHTIVWCRDQRRSADFDGILERVRARVPEIWADPGRTRPGEIDRFYGGLGFYFHDPDEHLLEVITRPYGDGMPGPEEPR